MASIHWAFGSVLHMNLSLINVVNCLIIIIIYHYYKQKYKYHWFVSMMDQFFFIALYILFETTNSLFTRHFIELHIIALSVCWTGYCRHRSVHTCPERSLYLKQGGFHFCFNFKCRHLHLSNDVLLSSGDFAMWWHWVLPTVRGSLDFLLGWRHHSGMCDKTTKPQKLEHGSSITNYCYFQCRPTFVIGINMINDYLSKMKCMRPTSVGILFTCFDIKSNSLEGE